MPEIIIKFCTHYARIVEYTYVGSSTSDATLRSTSRCLVQIFSKFSKSELSHVSIFYWFVWEFANRCCAQMRLKNEFKKLFIFFNHLHVCEWTHSLHPVYWQVRKRHIKREFCNFIDPKFASCNSYKNTKFKKMKLETAFWHRFIRRSYWK